MFVVKVLLLQDVLLYDATYLSLMWKIVTGLDEESKCVAGISRAGKNVHCCLHCAGSSQS